MMKQFGRGFVLVSLASTFVLGCAGENTEGTEAPAIQAAPSGEASVALRIERVARALDRGEDAKQALAEIDLALAHPAATATERDEATLVRSRALEATGDAEGAITAVENLLAAHAGDREWALSAEAEKRLRKLLTGSEDTPKRRLTPAEPPVSIFATQLAKFFPPDAGGRYRVRVLAFGGDRNFSSDRIGTFNVGGAIRAEKEKTCSTCEVNVDSNTNRETSWVGIVRARAELATSLVVYYYDLEGGEIPARYDAELPLPSAEIKARLAKGKGLVAAKKREGAPPVILVAAPRFAQLDNVETTLAGMDELPLEATSVEVPESLEAEEIQAVVRGGFSSFRPCYEAVLQTNPAASGRIILDFKVGTDGHMTTLKATAESAATQPMEACMRDAAQGFVFPAATKETTVSYPILFTPGDD
ncbi:AgmX/PglI C-terminal domain-containing protein [Polyangium jinanense]|uniref:AgmX/PglI C-terminal domain-containing protein n=1 Tax=Polyangium jinanense TaxID=2829994 RepID=A0A9X3XFB3_9BACT|nr:AgmX/PglI C-terminal domain-containing protein [Polyangium jinanense]MDC3962729.1 AgmX/PglI C-terminal domain-containing protein [Polyangium jinanense]MDC3989339.1 AgmX/PglI C-terminal domain-containing protein [Polyangium jinanense]